MRRVSLLAATLLGSWLANAAETNAVPPSANRSDLFTLVSGDRLEDSGRLLVNGARSARVEDFEVVRTADGGRVLTAVVTGGGNSYRVQGRWTYDAEEQALSAEGIGNYGDAPLTVFITRAANQATVVASGSLNAIHAAPCAADCLVDLAPSAMAMFTMTRRYDEDTGGPQIFRWIGRSLTGDQLLLDGSAEIEKLGDGIFRQGTRETAVQQWSFVETLTDAASGQVGRMSFNLYTTADHRPLAFATGGTTVGERDGFQGITKALPPKINRLP